MNSYLGQKLTILVVGFDGYNDVWNHDFFLMNKYWPDRPRTILANSELQPDYSGVEIVNAGKCVEWSKKVQEALKIIDTDYVLLMLEDFFITEKIDDDRLIEIINIMDDNDMDYCQLLLQAVRQKYQADTFLDTGLLIIPTDKKYPLNLQAAIWKREFLIKAVGDENYNAWKFEINHINDQVNIDHITCVIDTSNILKITHGIVQGKYLRSAKKKLNKIGCNITDVERETLSFKDELKYNFKLIMYGIIPKRLEKIAKRTGRLLKIDFVTDRLSGKE